VGSFRRRSTGRPASVAHLGRLPLGIVEVRGNRDDSACELPAEACLRALTQRAQDFRGDFDRRLDAAVCGDPHHAGIVDKAVGKAPRIGEIGQPASHQALHRDDCVLRVRRLL
jgi:hypothetical protein